jgi:hypothetical protein
VPTAIKLQAEYGEDLQVLFVESQGASHEKAERFALDHEWLGGLAMWTSERPFSTGLGGLPSCALLSAEGEVLIVGMNSSVMSKVEDELEAWVKAKKRLPKGTPSKLKKAWTYYQKGKLARALAELDELGAEGGEVAEAAEALAGRIAAQVESRLKGISWMLNNGFPVEAKAKLDELAGSVEDHTVFSGRCAELQARFAADDIAAELKAAKAFAKLEKKLFKDGSDEKLGKKFAKLAESFAGTKVAERANHYAKLMG